LPNNTLLLDLLTRHRRACALFLLKCPTIGVGFDGAKTNCEITGILGTLPMNGYFNLISNGATNRLWSVFFKSQMGGGGGGWGSLNRGVLLNKGLNLVEAFQEAVLSFTWLSQHW